MFDLDGTVTDSGRAIMSSVEYIHTVQYYETDKMGITHHSNYIRWMEEARIDFLYQIGWDYAKLEEKGIVSPVLNVSCDYKQSTTFSDHVHIRVTVKEFKGVKLHLAYEMKNQEGKLVCSGTSTHAFINLEGKPIRMKQEHPELFETLSSLATNN
jgi:acyl-CoA thioester hydrolase